jgi:hypothetical protein
MVIKTTDAQDINLYRDIVSIAIEKALSIIGSPVADEVSLRLNETYNCDFGDCLEHPENLNNILKDIFGQSYFKVVKLINDQLIDMTFDKPIESFLEIIRK